MDNWLYSNIGGKIKNLAKWSFIVETVSAILSGVAMIFYAFVTAIAIEEFAPLLLIFVAPFAVALAILGAWIASWFMYAFGELVERVCSIDDKMNAAEESGASYSGRLKQIADEKSDRRPAPRAIVHEDEWRCPNCGLVHKSYVGTCGCGTSRPAAAAPKAPTPTPQEPVSAPQPVPKPAPTLKADEWYCPECGLVHKTYVGSCGCGRQKP